MVRYWTEWKPPPKPIRQQYTLNRQSQCVVCGGEYKSTTLYMGRVCRFCKPHVHHNQIPRYLTRGKHNPYD